MEHQPSSERPGVFKAFHDQPDPSDHELGAQRQHQWRPFSQNPFAGPETYQPSSDTQGQGYVEKDSDDIKPIEKPAMHKAAGPRQSHVLENPGPSWVYLFYDLAWTATFSSLTENGQFNEGLHALSYVVFFFIVWWLWASQALYSIHFYTNDWFHLISIFLQLCIFGALAATTRGFDIGLYIKHSPGIEVLDPKTTDEIYEPERYLEERMARLRVEVIAIAVVASRIILLIQHLRVLAYAHVTARKQENARIPRKLYTIPLGLIISLSFFIAAWVVSASAQGRTHSGAKLKYIFWGVGLIVEIASHIRMSLLDWRVQLSWTSWWQFGRRENMITSQNKKDSIGSPQAPGESPNTSNRQDLHMPDPPVTIHARLEAITTIILGEGMNGIAKILYNVLSTPGLGGPTGINVASSAFIVSFIAYFYFEGPTAHLELKQRGARQVYWLLLHFPLLLGIVILLLGVKNQFLLTSFLATGSQTYSDLNTLFEQENIVLKDPTVVTNIPIKNYLLRCGISWLEEYQDLINRVTRNGTDPIREPLSQVQMDEFESFMNGLDKVSADTKSKYDNYLTNLTLPHQDHLSENDPTVDGPNSLHYYSILTELLEESLQGTRYVVAPAGAILITLGLLNLVHSRPRDCYQWGVILSRIGMGFFLLILLLLNLGHYQTLWTWDGQEHRQAGVFRWLWAYWVLPTVACAFGLQFVVEMILLWLAVLRTKGTPNKTTRRLAQESLVKAAMKPFRMFKKSE